MKSPSFVNVAWLTGHEWGGAKRTGWRARGRGAGEGHGNGARGRAPSMAPHKQSAAARAGRVGSPHGRWRGEGVRAWGRAGRGAGELRGCNGGRARCPQRAARVMECAASGHGMPSHAPRRGAAARWGHRALPQRETGGTHGRWARAVGTGVGAHRAEARRRDGDIAPYRQAARGRAHGQIARGRG